MVLVFAESVNGTFKKAAFEAVTYAYQTAEMLGVACEAIVLGKAGHPTRVLLWRSTESGSA